MKKIYRGQVMVAYYQEITVEAETPEDAELLMCEQFDLSKAESGTANVYDLEEIGDSHAHDR